MYKKHKHIHFMGIGGIGMSGIAEILKLQGYAISGCDTCSNTQIITHLKEIGCKIYNEHNQDHIKNADVLVYSSIIKKENPEVIKALKKGIPIIPRAIMLAELMRTKYGIAVSGSHGKTTTTSIISHILIEANLDPTVVIGGILKNISSNAKLGEGNLLIAEADESDRSLLYLNPSFAVVTNIDVEHLDIYKNLNDIKQTFKNFLARLPFYGKAFLCTDDTNIKNILPLPHISTVKYGLNNKANIFGEIINLKKAESIFDVYVDKHSAYYQELTKTQNKKIKKFLLKKENDSNQDKIKLGRVNLNIPGEHNVTNSLAAIALCLELEVPFKKIKKALKTFKGIERRFEFKGTFKKVDIFDDYGHHPTEIKNTLAIAGKRAKNNLHVIFQPHKFSRTQKLWDKFVTTFSKDKRIKTLCITDIYPASEKPIPGINSKNLVLAIKSKNPTFKVFYYQSYEEIIKKIPNDLEKEDLLITIGAGKINQVGEALVKKATLD